jgi:predicted transcriptional regulator
MIEEPVAYWVLKGTRDRNDFARNLRPGAVETWRTAAPPTRLWSEGDRVFVWKSSPDRCLVGLGDIVRIRGTDKAGVARFDVRYFTRELPRPLGLDELREHRKLADASFLKAGPAAALLSLSRDEGRFLAALVGRENPIARRVVAEWTERCLRAISIRQPYTELIFRGEKRYEFRSSSTNVRGRVYVYASLKPSRDGRRWKQVDAEPGGLPTGVIVGTVAIVGCRYIAKRKEWGWELARPRRLSPTIAPMKHPQPVWFFPF